MSRYIPIYMMEQLLKYAKAVLYPESMNCHGKGKTHNWGAGDHGWSTKECHDCGRLITGCGM